MRGGALVVWLSGGLGFSGVMCWPLDGWAIWLCGGLASVVCSFSGLAVEVVCMCGLSGYVVWCVLLSDAVVW